MKALVGAFNQEKDIVGAFSVITNLRVDLRLAQPPKFKIKRISPTSNILKCNFYVQLQKLLLVHEQLVKFQHEIHIF